MRSGNTPRLERGVCNNVVQAAMISGIAVLLMETLGDVIEEYNLCNQGVSRDLSCEQGCEQDMHLNKPGVKFAIQNKKPYFYINDVNTLPKTTFADTEVEKFLEIENTIGFARYSESMG
jgi:hypothetical protein